MDDFGQFLMGGQPKTSPKNPPPAAPTGTNQFNVGNLRPIGQSTGFQQPASYEEGIRAMDKNLEVYGTKHKINTLKGVISRYAPASENDTEAYIKFVAQRTGLDPNQEIDLTNPAVRHVITGPMILMEKGGKNIFGGKQAVQAKAQDQSDPFASFMMGGQVDKTAEQPTVEGAKPVSPKLKPKLFGKAEGMEDSSKGFYEKFEERSKRAREAGKQAIAPVAALADTLTGIVPGAVGDVTYSVARAFGKTPEQATKISQSITEPISQPFGKSLGITQIPEYKGEASRRAMEIVGQFVGESAEDISKKTGIPKEDVENMLATLATGIGAKLPSATQALPKLQAQLEKRFPKIEEASAVAPVAAQSGLVGVGAAKVEINPYAGKITGEESARGQYPTVKLSKIKEDVVPTEQAMRADIANEVLGNTGQVRSGVITGNENTLRQEYTESKSANPTPRSEILKKQIADEQNALTRYAEQRIDATGASKNLPSDYERGQLMNDAIASNEGLTGFFKTTKEGLYNEARLKVGDNPVASNTLENLLNSTKFKSELKLKGIKDFTEGLGELLELHKTQGFEGTKPGSIAGLEELRKSVNAQWTPQNKREIGRIVKAIDEDIAKAGGEDLYKKARSVHQAEQKIFESKGMDKLFGEVDANGVQTATDFQAIPKKLNQMPADQWKHIYDTYDEISKGRVRGVGFDLELTPELIDYANAAKAEMRGALAREIYQAGAGKAGVWNQNSVNNILNARAKKIEHAFTPEEQKAFHTLNYAGHIMPGVHAYEGAALQGQRVNKFAEKFPMIGRETGAVTRIPFGATIGEKIGEKAAQFTIGRSQKKQASKLQEEMTKNAEKGKTNLKDIGKE
jgi:hypothetical protein